MSTARKITVVLTDTQYMALAHAVALASEELEVDGEGAADRGTLRALSAGWDRINAAWHERKRGAARHE
jgi:hypothetical protein